MAKKKVRPRGARRKISDAARPETPESKRYDALSERVFCPECKRPFYAGELYVHEGNKRCPQCGADMGEATMDGRARSLLAELESTKGDRAALAKELDGLQQKLDEKTHWWQFFSRRRLHKRIATCRQQLEEKEAEVDRLSTWYGRVLYGRYYCSEWFRLSHIPLARMDIGKELDYCLKPQLVEWSEGTTSVFRLAPYRPNRSIGRGIAAEFRFFEFMRGLVEEASSPLFAAHVLPDLFLPQVLRSGRTVMSQVDCLVLTRSCAFVVEVKSWHAGIAVEAPFERIHVVREGKPQSTDAPLYQNSQHAIALDDCCAAYPFERIYELTVFVDPVSFEGNGGDFSDHVLVSALPDRASELAMALEEAAGREEPLMTQQELDELANALHDKYWDQYQTLDLIHIHRVKREHRKTA